MSGWAPSGRLVGSSLAFGTPICSGERAMLGYEVEGSHSESAHAEDDHSPDGHGVHPVSLVLRPAVARSF